MREGNPERNGTEAASTTAFEIYREIIRENLEYDIMIDRYKYDVERIDGIVDLMLETVCTAKKTLRIVGIAITTACVSLRSRKQNRRRDKCLKTKLQEIQYLKQWN